MKLNCLKRISMEEIKNSIVTRIRNFIGIDQIREDFRNNVMDFETEEDKVDATTKMIVFSIVMLSIFLPLNIITNVYNLFGVFTALQICMWFIAHVTIPVFAHYAFKAIEAVRGIKIEGIIDTLKFYLVSTVIAVVMTFCVFYGLNIIFG